MVTRSDRTREGGVARGDGPGATLQADDRLQTKVLGPPGSASDRNTERLLLRALINSVPDYLFVKDTERPLRCCQPAVAEDLGLSVEDLIGKTDFELHRADTREEILRRRAAVMSSGEPQIDIEEFVVTATGEKKWLSTSKLPLRNAEGEVIGIVGVCRDITERKHAEDALAESESRWNFALEGAGQGVWDHDLRNKTAFFSPMWRKMRGIGLDEQVDPSREAWLARVHPDDRQRIVDEADQQNSGDAETELLRVPRAAPRRALDVDPEPWSAGRVDARRQCRAHHRD